MSLTDEDKQWIRAQLKRIKTSLLSEFHKWELKAVGDRVTELERDTLSQ